MKYLAVKYVHEVTDRYGNKRLYFRRSGYPSVRLMGAPGSAEFAESYQSALDQRKVIVRPGVGRISVGTFADLRSQYYDSLEFKSLQDKTRENYRAILEKLSPLDDMLVSDLTRADVLRIRDKGDSISLMKRLKTLLNFAVDREFRPDNPADKVKLIGERKPFRAWTEGDISKFLAAYKPESRENLAITLLLYTGARRSDVVTFGWHSVNGDLLIFTPRKTSHGKGDARQLIIPIHSKLKSRLASCPKDAPAFLMTEYGKPMSEFGFSNWFSAKATDAKLPPQSSPHGLRKAASRRLAEAGCSASQIAAITGHSTLKEVERYTASSDQARLARSAMRLLASAPENEK